VRPGQALLEIGPGNGFTSGYLRGQGFEETTLDIGPGKHPGIVANVATFDFPRADVAVLACEVFATCGFRIERRQTGGTFRFYALRAPRREPEAATPSPPPARRAGAADAVRRPRSLAR